VKVVQQLIAYFEAKGRIKPRQLAQLTERGYWGQYTSGDLRSLEGKVGQSFYFQVTGATHGPLWGTDVYTSDSSLEMACVHAGLLRPGESGVVRVTIVPPITVYRGSARNGVSSADWTTGWSGAYRVEPVRAATGASW
jgi:hypothetical protein